MRTVLWFLLVFTMILLVSGILMISTAGELQGVMIHKDSSYFMYRQLMHLIPAVLAGILFALFNYRFYRNKWVLATIALGMILLLALVFMPGVGVIVKGSRRWIDLVFFRLQPSELVKLGVVIVLAGYMDRITPRVKRWIPGFWIPVALLGILVVPVLLQPDFGCALVICGLGLMMLLAGNVRVSGLCAVGLIGLVLIGALIWANPNRRARLMDYFGKEEVVSAKQVEAQYHLNQSKIAFRNGGPTGVGFGNSLQKYHYLPESHTDFIYAIVAEELGFPATFGLLLVFVGIMICGFWIALHAADRLGTMLAFGATVLIVGQAAANMAVVTGVLPTKGLALPFISYGGSHLIVALASVGLLFNIGWRSLIAEEEGLNGAARNLIREI